MSPTTGRDCEMFAAIRVGADADITCMVDPAMENATITLGRGVEVILDEQALSRLHALTAEGLRAFREPGTAD